VFVQIGLLPGFFIWSCLICCQGMIFLSCASVCRINQVIMSRPSQDRTFEIFIYLSLITARIRRFCASTSQHNRLFAIFRLLRCAGSKQLAGCCNSTSSLDNNQPYFTIYTRFLSKRTVLGAAMKLAIAYTLQQHNSTSTRSDLRLK
jgi:hypothetical protein